MILLEKMIGFVAQNNP